MANARAQFSLMLFLQNWWGKWKIGASDRRSQRESFLHSSSWKMSVIKFLGMLWGYSPLWTVNSICSWFTHLFQTWTKCFISSPNHHKCDLLFHKLLNKWSLFCHGSVSPSLCTTVISESVFSTLMAHSPSHLYSMSYYSEVFSKPPLASSFTLIPVSLLHTL